MYDLQVFENQKDVVCTAAQVSFPAFDSYMEQAKKFADYIRHIEVTEDNIKEVKKDLASVRKVTDRLDKSRISLKKTLMEDFTKFENQVKEINLVISEAEEELRSKTRILDQQERDKKEAVLKEIWEKRKWTYNWAVPFENLFYQWLTPQHLNKTTTLSSAEADMVAWFEKRDSEIRSLKILGKEYVLEYYNSFDIAKAINAVDERNAISAALGQEDEEVTSTFIVTGEKDIMLTEYLLKQNNINYIKK